MPTENYNGTDVMHIIALSNFMQDVTTLIETKRSLNYFWGDGAPLSSVFGAMNTTPVSALDGNGSFLGFNTTTALTDAQMLEIHRQLARVED
jgi:hypothetical protein